MQDKSIVATPPHVGNPPDLDLLWQRLISSLGLPNVVNTELLIPCHIISVKGNIARIGTPTDNIRQKLEHYQKKPIGQGLTGILGYPVAVTFEVVKPEVAEVDWYDLDYHQDQEPKQVGHKLDGFTPVLDVVADELGLTPAVVFGLVWRHCQMPDGICRASVATLAKLAGIKSVKTVRGHLKALCDAGYIEDLTPDLRHRPHIYKDTGKVTIETETKVAINR